MNSKTIEVEDYDGNTIMAFKVNENLEVTKTKDCDVADIDGDYIFESGDELIRIQKS